MPSIARISNRPGEPLSDASDRLTIAPLRRGEKADAPAARWNEAWNWRDSSDASLFRGGVRALSADRAAEITLSPWEAGALRAVASSCESAVRAWQHAAATAADGHARDRCLRSVRVLDQASAELANLLHHTPSDSGVCTPPSTVRVPEQADTRSDLERLADAARLQSALCEKYASALAGAESDPVRILLNAQATRAELGLSDARDLLAAATAASVPSLAA